jgi:hypothetical protein
MINAKLQNLYNIKNDIGTAIVNKGGTITESTPFYSYAGEIDNISTGPGSYDNFVVQDLEGAKYTSITNISTGNVTGPNIVGTNEANMAFINNTANYGGHIRSVTTNNGFIYAGGYVNQTVQKFYESNLSFVGNTANYGGEIYEITTNNGFIYAGGDPLSGTNRGVSKYHESNLALVGNTANYGGFIMSITTNNGFIYVGGHTPRTVQKFHESNLAFVGNTASYGGDIYSVTTNNGFIYVGGETGNGSYTNGSVSKYHESNLSFVGNTANYGSFIISVTTNNGFIYAGGGTLSGTNRGVSKYHESNLALVGNTANYGGRIESVTTNNGFIIAGGYVNLTVQKFHESNLAFVGNTVSYGGPIFSVTANNGFIYAGGLTNQTVQKFQEFETVFEQIPTYAFNRWLLNNSTTASVLFNNTVMEVVGNLNGPGTVVNNSIISLIKETGFSTGRIFITNNILYSFRSVPSNGWQVTKYNPETLEPIASRTAYIINQTFSGGIAVGGNFIYIGSNRHWHKLGINNLQTIHTSNSNQNFQISLFGVAADEQGFGYFSGSLGGSSTTQASSFVYRIDNNSSSVTQTGSVGFPDVLHLIYANNAVHYIGRNESNGRSGVGAFDTTNLQILQSAAVTPSGFVFSNSIVTDGQRWGHTWQSSGVNHFSSYITRGVSGRLNLSNTTSNYVNFAPNNTLILQRNSSFQNRIDQVHYNGTIIASSNSISTNGTIRSGDTPLYFYANNIYFDNAASIYSPNTVTTFDNIPIYSIKSLKEE